LLNLDHLPAWNAVSAECNNVYLCVTGLTSKLQ